MENSNDEMGIGIQTYNYVIEISSLWRRRGSAVECRTLERESPGLNPLHVMAPLMATRCGDNKTKSL